LLRKTSPAWRLLAAQQAPFVISFLYKAFIQQNSRQYPEGQLQAQLESYRCALNAGAASGWAGAAAGAAGAAKAAATAAATAGKDAEPYPRSAKDYLNEWANDEHQWLRKFYPQGSDEPHFDLTPQASLAIEWLVEQRPQSLLDFVGTESRLITVFDLLQQIIDGMETDPEQRIKTLEAQKAALDREIEQIRAGHLTVYDETQIRERFAQAITIAREIQNDFRTVEQNFRDLDRRMREKVSTWSAGKGELLEQIFESHDGISNSEQGRSFQAFWRFLMSQSSQERFQANLEQILGMDSVRPMNLPHDTRNIQYDWIEASAYVQNTVAQLNAQLRRYVDENYLEEERRMLRLVRSFEHKAFVARSKHPKKWQLTVDATSPDINLPLDRPLFSPAEKPVFVEFETSTQTDEISADTLYSQVFIDRQKLLEHIDLALQTSQQVSLSDILEQHPLEQGLGELMAYVQIHAQEQAAFDSEDIPDARYPWIDEDGKTHSARTAELLFTRGNGRG
jgi:hypothetical protein